MKKVNVLGRVVPIYRLDLGESPFHAYYDLDNKTITMDSSLKGELFMHVLLHEIGHAIFCRGGLQQTQISHDLQELIVEQFATVIAENFTLKPKK
jgi:Zn-dependent peptidase ImmA (M78 family)